MAYLEITSLRRADASASVIGQPFEHAVCPVHRQEVGLNKNGQCPYCFVNAASGGRSTTLRGERPRREACPTCGDTRRPGKNGFLGCYSKQRKSECAIDYARRGIETALEVHTSYSEALGLVPVNHHEGVDPVQRTGTHPVGWDPQIEMCFEEPGGHPGGSAVEEAKEGEYIPPSSVVEDPLDTLPEICEVEAVCSMMLALRSDLRGP